MNNVKLFNAGKTMALGERKGKCALGFKVNYKSPRADRLYLRCPFDCLASKAI